MMIRVNPRRRSNEICSIGKRGSDVRPRIKAGKVVTQATAKQVTRGGLSKRARRKVRRKIRLAAHHSRSISVVGGLLL